MHEPQFIDADILRFKAILTALILEEREPIFLFTALIFKLKITILNSLSIIIINSNCHLHISSMNDGQLNEAILALSRTASH